MMIINEQEREHWDHEAGVASDFQNCFSEAQSVAGGLAIQYRKAIDAVLAAGRFAVVLSAPYYCRATDAVAGSVEYLRGDFESREQAQDAANRIYASEGLDSSEDLYVLPRVAPVPALVGSPVDSDDVPF